MQSLLLLPGLLLGIFDTALPPIAVAANNT